MNALDLESSSCQSFGERLFGERQEMVPEIPVLAASETDIRPNGEQPASVLQTTERLNQSPAERVFIRQVFEEIAGENHVQFPIGEGPADRAVLLDEPHGGLQVLARVRVQIHA